MKRFGPTLNVRLAVVLLACGAAALAPSDSFPPMNLTSAAAQTKGGGVELKNTRRQGGANRRRPGQRRDDKRGTKAEPRAGIPDPPGCVPRPAKVKADRIIISEIGMKLVELPPGVFCMGSTNGNADERPPHRVEIGYTFLMGMHEVTQEQWMAVMGGDNNPSHFKGSRLPVEQVSMEEVQEFIRRLNGMNVAAVYRLPTEAEWEYAARAGTVGDYAGDVDEMGWVYENSGDTPLSADSKVEPEANNNQTHPVGGKDPNGFGLHDMHGNVWEWCQDDYHDSYRGAPADGAAWRGVRPQALGVARGGAWYFRASSARSANRYKLHRDGRFASVGFRVAATLKPGRRVPPRP